MCSLSAENVQPHSDQRSGSMIRCLHHFVPVCRHLSGFNSVGMDHSDAASGTGLMMSSDLINYNEPKQSRLLGVFTVP